jgi:biotin carboxyl carrier protein
MRFKAEIDGEERPVAVNASGALSLGSDSYRTTITLLNPLKRRVTVGDRSFEVRLVDVDSDPEAGKYLFEFNGELVTVMVSDVVKGGDAPPAGPPVEFRKTKPTLDAVSGGVTSPMPGKIVDILVNPGDQVEPGQVVVILEAMKMENELSALSKGTVKAVAVKKGDSVQGGQLLISLE